MLPQILMILTDGSAQSNPGPTKSNKFVKGISFYGTSYDDEIEAIKIR